MLGKYHLCLDFIVLYRKIAKTEYEVVNKGNNTYKSNIDLLMRKVIYLLILSLLVIYAPEKVYSQFLYFGPSLGVSLPANDYVGSTKGYYNGDSYGLKFGVNFGAEARIVTPFVNIKGFYRYNLFKNTGDALLDVGRIQIKQYISEFGIGPEFMLTIPKVPVKPHVEAMFIYSVFSGSTDFRAVPYVPDGFYDMVSESRMGIGLGAGAEIKLKKLNFSIDVNVRYNYLNFLENSFSGGEDRLSSYIYLNDKTDPMYNGTDINHPVGSDRAISLFQFNVSIIYGVNF